MHCNVKFYDTNSRTGGFVCCVQLVEGVRVTKWKRDQYEHPQSERIEHIYICATTEVTQLIICKYYIVMLPGAPKSLKLVKLFETAKAERKGEIINKLLLRWDTWTIPTETTESGHLCKRTLTLTALKVEHLYKWGLEDNVWHECVKTLKCLQYLML